MNHLIRILVGSLCAALVAGACTKNDSAEQDQQVPMVFHASSEAAEVKSGTSAFPYDNFGIWGIARMSGESDYVLWEAAALTKVQKGTINGQTAYKPVDDAYWVTGYTYHFIALAPYGVGPTPTFSTNPTDAMTFSFDMAGYYDKPTDYTFDLLGTVAEATVEGPASQHASSQPLLFSHLLSQININVEFKKDANTAYTGTVNKIKLTADTNADYVVTCNNGGDMGVTCTAGTPAETDLKDIVFNKADLSTTAGQPLATVHVVPQPSSSMRLFLDFTVGTGDAAFSLENVEVNLTATGNPTNYGYNQSYNWNIIIGSKEDISFKVTVAPWIEQQVGNDIVIP